MTNEEIILFKELIKETVRSVVKEAVREELASTSFKKDLREVKLLLAKSIKEGYRPAKEPLKDGIREVPTDIKKRLREAIGSDFNLEKKRAPIPGMSSEQAMNLSMNGTLPDFDAPIPFMPKDSAIWEDLNKKIK